MRELTYALEVERRRNRTTDPKQGQIQFVSQGEETPDTRAPRRKSMLDKGHNWELRVHLDTKFVFLNIV